MEGLRLCRALWTGGNLPASLERAGKWFDGWFPIAPDPARFAAEFAQVHDIARAAGRDPQALTGAMYVTLALDADAAGAEARLNAFLEGYYGQPAAQLRRRQACYAGPAAGAAAWLHAYAEAGVGHLVVRLAGDHERQLEAIARIREEWR